MAKTKLPPDPERMNEQRAEWVEFAVTNFMRDTGTDREDALPDLIANMFHWCDRNGTTFARELQRACSHYPEETGFKGKQLEGWVQP